MDTKADFSWFDHWLDFWQIKAYVKAGICVLLTLAITVIWGIYATSTSTTFNIEYEWAQKIQTAKLDFSIENTTPSCDYPDCSNKAAKQLKTDFFYPHIMSGAGMETLLSLPNEPNFQSYTKTITYVDEEKHTAYEKNTYLTPQRDGRIKIETEMDKYVYYTSNGVKSFEQIYFAGNYCSEHLETAKTVRLSEVENAFTNTFGHFFSRFGLVFVLIPWILMCLLAACYATYYTLFKKASSSAT